MGWGDAGWHVVGSEGGVEKWGVKRRSGYWKVRVVVWSTNLNNWWQRRDERISGFISKT